MKLLIVFSLILSGCCSTNSQKVFSDAMDYWEGQRLSDPWFKDFIDKSDSRTHIRASEYEHRYINDQCEYSMLIDEKSQTIKSWTPVDQQDSLLVECFDW